jgi:hypothetical protein
MKKSIFLSLVLLVTMFVGSHSVFAQTTTILNGRVTNTNGYGISGVSVTVYQFATEPFCPDTTISQALTSPFGYYSMEVNYYCSMFIQPSKKNYTFTPESRFISGGVGPWDNIDFVGAQ